MITTTTYPSDTEEWSYLNLEIVPDPIVLQGNDYRNEFNSIEVDSLTWKQVVSSAMKKMYGVVGEASHFDVLHHKGRKVIIRIQPEDEPKFRNSLFSYVLLLESFIGSSSLTSDFECHLRVNSASKYLGLVVDQDLIES